MSRYRNHTGNISPPSPSQLGKHPRHALFQSIQISYTPIVATRIVRMMAVARLVVPRKRVYQVDHVRYPAPRSVQERSPTHS